MRKRLIPFIIISFLIAGCSDITQATLTQENASQIFEEVQKSKLSKESKDLFQQALTEAANSYNGKTVESIIVEQKNRNKIAEEKRMNLQIGDRIKTTFAEVKINNISFSHDVQPKVRTLFYTHYPAEKGNVYIDIDVDVKNLAEQNLPCNRVMKVTATYNNGYAYTGFPIVEVSSTGFTYANIMSIKPFEKKEMRFLIDVPNEVATNSLIPLFITFEIDNKLFKYTMR